MPAVHPCLETTVLLQKLLTRNCLIGEAFMPCDCTPPKSSCWWSRNIRPSTAARPVLTLQTIPLSVYILYF